MFVLSTHAIGKLNKMMTNIFFFFILIIFLTSYFWENLN